MNRPIRHALLTGVATAWLAGGIGLSAQAPATVKSAKPPAPAKSGTTVMPPAIKTAFDKAYPHAVVKHVAKEVEKGVTTYEVESLDGAMTRDIVYTPDGAVVEVEEGIAEADIPEPVRLAIAARYPKGTVAKAERLTRGAATLYEVQVTDAGRKHSMELDANGKPPAPAKAAKKVT